jgi:hypothetical protein
MTTVEASVVADMTLLSSRLCIAFQDRSGAAERFGILASACSIGTWIWWRDYNSRRQGLVGRVPNGAAVEILGVLVENLRALRRREADAGFPG